MRGENAKDEETRFLPISTRLAAVLEMAKGDPAVMSDDPDPAERLAAPSGSHRWSGI